MAYDSSQGVFYEKGKKMDIFGKYKSPLGYTLGTNNIDSYGVDHSGFTTRDEVAYQTARQQRENQIMQNYNRQGINKNHPQYGSDFWGSLPANNYGFGASNITLNVENMQNTPVPNIGPKPLSQEQMYTSPSHIGEILTSGLKGFGQGVLGGIEHGINTATAGGYDMFNDALFDNGYEHRQKELENLADTTNLGKAYKYANYAIDAGVDTLLGTTGIKKAKTLLNKIK